MVKPPPVPPQNQSPKGTGDPKTDLVDQQNRKAAQEPGTEKGQQANIKQNTTHQGYQQDR